MLNCTHCSIGLERDQHDRCFSEANLFAGGDGLNPGPKRLISSDDRKHTLLEQERRIEMSKKSARAGSELAAQLTTSLS